MKKERIKKNQKKEIGKMAEGILLLLPCLFAVGIVPLIVRVKDYDPGMQEYEWFPKVMGRLDVFWYYKSFAVTILLAAVLICMGYLYLRHRLRASRIFLLLGLYGGLILLSSVFSISEFHTWNGFLDMFESAFVLLCYCLLCFYSFTILRSEGQLKLVWLFFLIGLFCMGTVCFSQFIGQDIFGAEWLRKLIFPRSLAGLEQVYGTKLEDGIVYGTLYNPNYVGVYSCIVVPVLLVLTFTAKSKRWFGIYLLFAVPAMVCLVGSGSKTAVLALLPCLLFACFYFGRKNLKRVLPVVLVYVLLFAFLNFLQASSLFSHVVDRLTEPYVEDKEYLLTDITLNNEDYTITYGGEVLRVRYEEKEDHSLIPVVTDAAGTRRELTRETWRQEQGMETSWHFQDRELQFIAQEPEKGLRGFLVKSEDCGFFIYYSREEETYLYRNFYGDGVKMQSSPTLDLPVFHLMGGFSGRGYIWKKTLPLLKDTLLIGSGPDTFALKFPQTDYVSLVQNGWESYMITKPHCMYLQIGVQTGVLSLAVFLLFELGYVMQSFRLYQKKMPESFAQRFGAAIFLMNLAFLVASMVNDSTVGVSVIYWVLLGSGFACNEINRKQRENLIKI